MHPSQIHIDIPAFGCPIKLKGYTKDEIFDWIEKIIDNGIDQNPIKTYTAVAIKYWLRQAWLEMDRRDPRFEFAFDIIDDYFQSAAYRTPTIPFVPTKMERTMPKIAVACGESIGYDEDAAIIPKVIPKVPPSRFSDDD